jgi:hypothetical protein
VPVSFPSHGDTNQHGNDQSNSGTNGDTNQHGNDEPN